MTLSVILSRSSQQQEQWRHLFLEDSLYYANQFVLTGVRDPYVDAQWTEAMKRECLDESETCHKYLLSLLENLVPSADKVPLDPRAREIDKLEQQ